MRRNLIKKYLRESQGLGIALAVILFAFPWVRIWTVSQFELSGFAPLIEQFRAFERFSPVPLEQFLTYEGMIGLTFDEPVLLLCVLAWSIARGSDVVSGELGRGTMEMLLAQPIRRWHLVVSHGMVSVAGLAILCFLVFAGTACGIWTNVVPIRPPTFWTVPLLGWNVANPWMESQVTWQPLTELVAPSLYVLPTLNLFSLGFAMLGMSAMVSSFDQYRWRTIGVTIGIYVLQLLLFILAKSTPRMSGLKPFTFLAAYQPDWMVQTIHARPNTAWRWILEGAEAWDGMLGPMGYNGVLLGLGALAYGIAVYRFETRDLPAPH